MQAAIFAKVEALAPGEHLVVEALAGTGKSTTIEEAVTRTPAGTKVLVCAFNKSIATALAGRLPRDVECATLHSVGFRLVRKAFPDRRPGEGEPYVSRMAREYFGNAKSAKETRQCAVKLVSIAKGCLLPAERDALDEAADTYEIDFPKRVSRTDVIRAACHILTKCERAEAGPIDFDDMIWLPEIWDLAAPEYDFVFVDETQDLNAAQLALVRRLAGERGSIIAVGDRRQAIYGFRGADREAIPRMISELGAAVLPLSVTYRCPLAVVAQAAALVPALQAAPNAARGEVRTCSEQELFAKAQPGDMVLSRTNAPLLSLCFRWLAAGRRASIKGRDIGEGLVRWILQQEAPSVKALRAAIDKWEAAEVERLAELGRDSNAAQDKAACLRALCEDCDEIDEVLARAEVLFSERPEDDVNEILLSSTHRAKGLEADRVWVLRDTYCAWPGAEEENLLYVAITRSKQELIYVLKDPEEKESEES
jgi:DNA helicase II / ATP-dependent DNA helicase PcrA